jgi:hypothetical protein
MRPNILGILLALGFLVAAVSGAAAQGTPASPTDSTATKAVSTAPTADSTAAMPAAPAAATPAAAPAAAAPAAAAPAAAAPAAAAPAAAAPAATAPAATAPAPTPAPAAAAPAPTAAAPAPAAPAPAPAATPAPASKSAPNDRIYYGGTVTLSFGSTTSVGFYPMLAYKLTPKISAGVEAGYEYVSYDFGPSTHNYGGSVFGRYRVGRNLYAHGEYEVTNYEIFETRSSSSPSSREWVPALLLGGGYCRAAGARTSLYAEVLFDVLQDANSPYGDWEPIVRFGVAVGF